MITAQAQPLPHFIPAAFQPGRRLKTQRFMKFFAGKIPFRDERVTIEISLPFEQSQQRAVQSCADVAAVRIFREVYRNLYIPGIPGAAAETCAIGIPQQRAVLFHHNPRQAVRAALLHPRLKFRAGRHGGLPCGCRLQHKGRINGHHHPGVPFFCKAKCYSSHRFASLRRK